jgi:hypothetical protein
MDKKIIYLLLIISVMAILYNFIDNENNKSCENTSIYVKNNKLIIEIPVQKLNKQP